MLNIQDREGKVVKIIRISDLKSHSEGTSEEIFFFKVRQYGKTFIEI